MKSPDNAGGEPSPRHRRVRPFEGKGDSPHVAASAGFGSLSAFSRAFRRAYGVAPSRWDRRSRLTFRTAETSPAQPSGVPDLDELVAAGAGPPVDVRLREVPPLTLAYIRVWSGSPRRLHRLLYLWIRFAIPLAILAAGGWWMAESLLP